MLRSRLFLIVAVLVLLFGAMALTGCSSSDDATEETADTVETTSDSGLAGTWENAEAYSYPEITFADDGTGMISDIDGDEAEMEWSLEDDYLEISLEYDGMEEMTGGGFTWVEEGSEFTWDADGTYIKAE